MEIAFLLDTSAYSLYDRGVGDERLDHWLNSKAHMYIPYVIVAELRAGYAGGNRKSENELRLQKTLSSPDVTVLFPTLTTTTLYAEIYAQLKRAGTPIGSHDIWIAALAMEHHLPLLTRDTDFKKVKGITILD